LLRFLYVDTLLFFVAPKEEPSAEYELTRRRLENGVREMWYFFGSELHKLQKLSQSSASSPQLATRISHILEHGIEHKRYIYNFVIYKLYYINYLMLKLLFMFRSLLQSAQQLARVDGYAEWRTKEAKELSDLVQHRLHFLQNPSDCASARKLVCNLNKVQKYN
jgi:glycoprotein 6-alpha-L-fucosyltransferase